uniref:Uncharacterized protein n=1 Tax=Physcomitrium patens TaxID=3218 RepID=A0A2K1IFS3_PHYPA|nr:hypothetical protein PHYPA_028718 [Physcomitrium patens]
MVAFGYSVARGDLGALAGMVGGSAQWFKPRSGILTLTSCELKQSPGLSPNRMLRPIFFTNEAGNGTGPVSWFPSRFRVNICGKEAKEAGIGPESLLLLMERNLRFSRFFKESGILLPNEQEDRSSLTRLFNMPIGAGMFPTREFEFRKRSSRFVKCPSDGGNRPVSSLWLKSRKVRELSPVKVSGKLPERWLWLKASRWS